MEVEMEVEVVGPKGGSICISVCLSSNEVLISQMDGSVWMCGWVEGGGCCGRHLVRFAE